DGELVPEDVAAIGLPVEAARGNASIQVSRVGGAGLKNVGGVEAKQELDPVVVGHPDVAIVPQFVPRTLVTIEGLVEGAKTPDRLLGVGQGLVDRLIVRGVERDELLDTDRSSLLEVKAQRLMGVVLHPIAPALGVQLPRGSVHARSSCLG